MKKKKYAFVVGIMLMIVLFMAQAVYAVQGAGLDGTEPAWSMSKDYKWRSPAEFLDLTAEQSVQMKKIHQDHFNSTRDDRIKLQEAMFNLRQLTWDKNPDLKKLEAAKNEVKAIKANLRQEAAKKRGRMIEVLTPEQLAEIGRKSLGCSKRGI